MRITFLGLRLFFNDVRIIGVQFLFATVFALTTILFE